MYRMVGMLFAAMLLVPLAQAHGAPEPRDIDERALADGTASGDYGLIEGALSDGAPDLLVLDIREAADAAGQPMVVFRFIHQLGDTTNGAIGLDLTFDAGGSNHAYSMETADGLAYASSSFARIDGPFDVGDGTPKAVEGWVPHEELGISTGNSISNIHVTSSIGGTVGDRMPGTYDLLGIMVPAVPPEDATPGAYQAKGPAQLFDATISATTLQLGSEDTATIDITNRLAMEQFVSLTAAAPDGVTAALDNDGILLAPNETRQVSLGISGTGEGEVALTVSSDLGGFRTMVLPLIGMANTGDDSNVLSDDIDNGGSFQHTFTTVGTFDYHCHPHPWMIAKVTIDEADNATPPQTHTVRIVEPDAADGQSWRFEPADLTIEAGDTVAWVNEGSQIHVIMGGVAGDGHHGGGDHGPAGHHEEGPTDNGLPGFEPILIVAALGAVATMRRGRP